MVEKKQFLYEVLIRGSATGIKGAHVEYCQQLIDTDTGELLKESITKAAKVELADVGTLLGEFCQSHLEQVSQLQSDLEVANRKITELTTTAGVATDQCKLHEETIAELEATCVKIRDERSTMEKTERQKLRDDARRVSHKNEILLKRVRELETQLVVLKTMKGASE